MKKLALLISLVLVFSLSSVLAVVTPDVASGEVISGEEIDVTGAVVSGEEAISGEDADEVEEVTPVASEVETPSTDKVEDEAVKSNNSATIGAIIAIVIVVAVVAIAAVLRKD